MLMYNILIWRIVTHVCTDVYCMMVRPVILECPLMAAIIL